MRLRRIFGLVGAPRAGKDVVAKFLQETRNFDVLAFADKIKEEFGISKEDFEAAKISGDIKSIRKELWAFSDRKKAEDPMYFINKVVEQANLSNNSVVVTDVRTPEELNALNKCGARIYLVYKSGNSVYNDDNLIPESKISRSDLESCSPIKLKNPNMGLYNFYKELDKFFFVEDLMDLSDSCGDRKNLSNLRGMVHSYVEGFNIAKK